MKKSIRIVLLFCAALIAYSCETPYSISNESAVQGVYPAINGTPKSVLFYYNQPTSSYSCAMKVIGTVPAKELDTYVVVGTVETLVQKTTFPADSFKVTLQAVATALNKTVSSFAPGASVILRNKIIGTDGNTYSGATTEQSAGGLLSGTAYNNLFQDLTVFVTCPFVATTAAGTYTVIEDDWVDYYPGNTLTVSAIDATHIVINEYPATYGNNHHGLVITVDPTSGTATVLSQNSGGYAATDVEYTSGSGFVFSCVGYIKLVLNFNYNGGAYNGYTLIISK